MDVRVAGDSGRWRTTATPGGVFASLPQPSRRAWICAPRTAGSRNPIKRAQPDTPVGKNRRSQAVNLRASAEHEISDRAIEQKEMNSYIDTARSSLGESNWAAIAGDATKNLKGNRDVLDSHEHLVKLVATARKISRKPTGNVVEKVFYGPTTQLCNRISLAVFDLLKDSRPPADREVAYVFTTQAGQKPKGDFLVLQYTPDYCSFSGTRAELEVAAAAPNYARSICWPEMGMVGEQKRWKENGKGQIKSYLSTLKRYRPDIPTVHGVLVHRGRIQLSQLNACGMWSSSRTDVGNLDAWIAFIVLLYQSYQHRDHKLVFNAQQTEFVRWDFIATPERPLQTPLVLAPFYAAPAPGRVTFASYQVASADEAVDLEEAVSAFYGPDVKGFWKTSWQQQGRSKERELLDRLHADNRWLPGLVRRFPDTPGDRLRIPTVDDIVRRPQRSDVNGTGDGAVDTHQVAVDAPSIDDDRGCRPASGDKPSFALDGDLGESDDDNEIEDEENFEAFLSSMPTLPPDVVERVQDILHLGSIGEPLSQCESPRQLLFCAYDLLETHIHMWEEGVLHRDVSWFNVLCNPKHYVGEEAEAKARPCIRKILHLLGKEGATTPLDNSEGADLTPCVLLTDLDHASDTKVPGKSAGHEGRERTGTAMFISFELSDHTATKYRSIVNSEWEELLEALNYVEEHDLGPAALARAFPDDDDHRLFMDRCCQVKALEAVRSKSKPGQLTEVPVHSPRHDAESIFWVFLWAFARAKPRGTTHEEDTKRRAKLATFAQSMLRHEVGNENDRLKYLMDPDHLANLFHPSLAAFENLFVSLAAYLRVPWHLYTDIVSANHVHIAFRRIILGFILRTDPDLLDVILDTEAPRRVILNRNSTRERLTPVWSADISAVGGSERASLLDKMPNLASNGVEADAADTGPLSSACSGPLGAHDRPSGSVASQSSCASHLKRKGFDADDGPARKRTRADTPTQPERHSPALSLAARQATRYVYELHFHSRSAHALRLKTWKDRMFWFTKGY